jgi:trehalose/maltose transport system permease protein
MIIALMVVFLVFPFYWMLNSALKSENQLQMTPGTFIPRHPETRKWDITLENFIAAFQNEGFLRGISNSAIVASATVFIALVTGSFAGFALGKLRFKGKKPILYLVLAMTMFPQISVLSGLYALIRWLNIHPIPGMVLSYLLFTLPFTVWVQTSFFKALPSSMLQAAYVDGASSFQIFYLIMLPLTAPALVTTGLIAFVNAWNEYLFALTFTAISPQAQTVPVAMAMFTGQFSLHEPFGEIMAAGVLVMIPLILLVLIFQRKIIAGLTAGAVKG